MQRSLENDMPPPCTRRGSGGVFRRLKSPHPPEVPPCPSGDDCFHPSWCRTAARVARLKMVYRMWEALSQRRPERLSPKRDRRTERASHIFTCRGAVGSTQGSSEICKRSQRKNHAGILTPVSENTGIHSSQLKRQLHSSQAGQGAFAF